MATAVPPELPSAGPSRDDRSEMVEYDRYIATQIQRTRRQVKGVELASTLLILATGLLAYGFLVALIDSWVLTGGMGTWGRLAAFIILVAGAGSYTAWRVLPLLRRRVNPIYAAHTIEQGQPSLKNSLINFLLLQGDRSRLPVPVYEAIERRAAQDLSTVPADSTVDRSPVIRAGYVLLALVTIFCLYSLISPKSPLKSLRRMLFPWSSVSAPTRVTIGDVRPGPARAFVGESLTISALVRGTRKDEPVTLYFTTEDGQSVDQPLPMQPPSDSYRHEVVLPPIGGLQQTLDYRIAAGDAQVGPYRVQVLAAPSILIEQVRYEYPAYTGLSPRVVEREGDLKAIEGTQVTLHAKTNVDMTSAYVDFNSDGSRDLELSCNGRTATGTFEMRLDPERKPLYTTYQLLFTDSAKQLNPQPIRYKIEVLPDQTPEIEINQPGADNYELPLNGALTVGVRASDRDFGLRRVTLFFERAGKRIHTVELLDKPQNDAFTGAHVFEPSKLTATPVEVGDTLQYWAEARDNRAPTANHVQTIKYRLKIVDKVDDGQREQQLADAKKKAEEAAAANKPPEAEVRPPDENTEKTLDPKAPAEEATDPAGAKAGEVKDPTGQEEAARTDPDGDAAAAMEKILEYQKQKEESPPDEQKSEEQKQSPEEQQDAEQKDEQGGGEEGSGGQGNKSGKKEGGEGKSGSKSSDQSDDSGEQSSQGGEESGQGKDSSNGKSGQGNKSGSKQQSGKSQQAGSSAEGSESKADGSQNSDGKPTPNAKPSGKPSGKKQPGSKPQGTKPQGDKKDPGAKQPQEGSPDAANPSGDNNSQPPTGAKPPNKPGEQPKGAEKAGSDQQGEGKSGQKPQGDKPQPGQQPGKESGGDQAGDQQQEQQQGDQPQDGKQSQQGGKPNDDGKSPKQSSGEKPGDGDATAGSGTPEQNKEKQGGEGKEPPQGDQPMPTGGDPEQSKGEGGGGKPDSKPSPTPAAQEANQPRNQGSPPPDQKPGEKKSEEEASSPSNSPKQSKQHSDEQGDRSADGSKGGGQKSESPGTGSPGQNTESDEGSGEANQPGAGETKAGQGDQESDKPTGEPGGQQKGEGSSTKPSQGKQGQSQSQSGPKQPGGQQSGGGQQKAGGAPSPAGGGNESTQPGKNPGNAGSGATPPPENPGNSKGDIAKTTDEMNANDPNGKSTGGGQAGADANPDQKPFEPAGTQADPLNNDYAQRATDLALESLQEQMAKHKVDPELLEKLNWSQDDMQRFVDRWQQLKRDAAKQGPEGDAARKKLDDTMERLGAARRGLTINSRENGPDKVQRLREGRGSKPPAEYREQFEAYTEGAAHRGK